MGRKRIHGSNSEKMQLYRESKKRRQEALEAEIEALKAEVEALKASLALRPVVDGAAIRQAAMNEMRISWESELHKEKLKAERKKGRELVKMADQNYAHGKVTGVCDCAAYFIGRDRPDLAQFLLSHFMIDRDNAQDVLQSDKRVISMTLKILDKAGAWDNPPAILR